MADRISQQSSPKGQIVQVPAITTRGNGFDHTFNSNGPSLHHRLRCWNIPRASFRRPSSAAAALFSAKRCRLSRSSIPRFPCRLLYSFPGLGFLTRNSPDTAGNPRRFGADSPRLASHNCSSQNTVPARPHQNLHFAQPSRSPVLHFPFRFASYAASMSHAGSYWNRDMQVPTLHSFFIVPNRPCLILRRTLMTVSARNWLLTSSIWSLDPLRVRRIRL